MTEIIMAAQAAPPAIPSPSEISWHRAATPGERLPAPVGSPTADPRVQRRFSRWREAIGLGPDESFAEPLAAVGLDESRLRALLAEDGGALRQRLDQPVWATEVARLGGKTASRLPMPDEKEFALLAAVAPLVGGYCDELRERAGELVAAANDSGVSALPEILVEGWPRDDLAGSLSRTLVLELNVARVEGRLRGDTPLERFTDFSQRLLRDPAVVFALWDEYPVLLRFVREVMRGWLDSRLEFVTHLLADLPLLRERHGADLGAITAVRFGAGDRHRGGRSVGVVTFTNGKVVYKPRCLAVDTAWQRVLDWFNGVRPPHRLAYPWVVERGDHGWMEFVEQRPCVDRDQAESFYWRLGALLALQYALGGTDVHGENVIAAGDQPILIDLEALFHPTPPDEVTQPWDGPAYAHVRSGVTRVGLLPVKMLVRDGAQVRSLDLSAVGMADGQESLYPLAVVSDAGTDEMRFVEERITVPVVADSRVQMDGVDVDPRDYVSALADGLTWTYRHIVADRDHWLEEAGLLDRFARVPLRYIPRPTMFYGRLLGDSLHPDFLRDAMERGRCLLRLAAGADGTGSWERLVPHELADLTTGDIPYFELVPAACDLWDSRGERIADYLPVPPLAAVRRKVETLGEEDLAIQRRLLQHAMASLASGAKAAFLPGDVVDLPAAASAADLDEAARVVATRICQTAIRDREYIGWLTLSLLEEQHWEASAASADLYAGLPGIGLFLAAAATMPELTSGEIVATAHQVAQTVDAQMRRTVADTAPLLSGSGRDAKLLRLQADPGGFGAIGGCVHYLAHASELLDRPELADTAELLLDLLDAFIEWDERYDLVSGSAGAVMAALALHAVRPGGGALRTAERAAEAVVTASKPAGTGVGWFTSMGKEPLTGMSHGASGMVTALSRLHAVAPRPEYAHVITEALRYERARYDREAGNWPDLRDERVGGSGDFMSTWCHGAPGIGLARWELFRSGVADLHPDGVAGAEEELGWAVAATRRSLGLSVDPAAVTPTAYLFGCNGPCHGDLGNLELLALDAERRDDESSRALVGRVATAICAQARRTGWRTGVPGVQDTPGLMYGLSGIGLQLLRLPRLDRIPSVLLLEPPVGRAG